MGGTIRYRVADMHTAGEPVRILVGGGPVLEGATLLERRRDAQARHDGVRRALMLEPRGHAGMYGAMPVPPCLPGADLAVLFTHTSGYSTMCGHATIALGRWAVEEGLVAPTRPVTRFVLECPCGPVAVEVAVGPDGAVGEVAFESVPSWAEALDAVVDVDGFGAVRLDLGYGGAFYAILPASRLGLRLGADPVTRLAAAGAAVTAAVRRQRPVAMPEAPDLGFLYGTILTDDVALAEGAETQNLCVFGEGQIDRCPTGSGVTARLAVARARGLAAAGEAMRFRGPSGGVFTGAVARELPGERAAVVVRVAGRAWHMGRSEILVEPDDPLAAGLDGLSFVAGGDFRGDCR